MPFTFPCEYCGEEIVISFLKSGEMALCKVCGKSSKVPDHSQSDPAINENVTDEVLENRSVVNEVKAEYHGKSSLWLRVLSGLAFIPFIGLIPGIVAIFIALLSHKGDRFMVVLVSLFGMCMTLLTLLWIFNFAENFESSPEYAQLQQVQTQLRRGNLVRLVQIIEYYKLENGNYPKGFEQIEITEDDVINFSSSAYMDSTHDIPYYYELIDSASYYLLEKGEDRVPFTSDDMVPLVKLNGVGKIGLRLHPTGVAYYDSMTTLKDSLSNI